MPVTIDKEEILKRNPHVKKSQLEASIILAQQLIASGIPLSVYNLASPFSHRRIRKLKKEFALTKHTRNKI